MAGRTKDSRKRLVEDCEVIMATAENLAVCHRLWIRVSTTKLKPSSFRHWFECPGCGRRSFKLYRPSLPHAFACRDCHKLTYSSTQRHDARLAPFLKMSDSELQSIIENGNDRERRLALRARAYRAKASQKVLAETRPTRVLDFDN